MNAEQENAGKARSAKETGAPGSWQQRISRHGAAATGEAKSGEAGPTAEKADS